MSVECFFLALAATVVVQPLVDADVLEPSIQNEVDHAIAKSGVTVESARSAVAARWGELPFATNGMSRTDLAIRLVSEQKPDGRWRVGTNDYTAVAVSLLEEL